MTLAQRLALWYGTVLLVIVLLGAGVTELVARRLAAQRRTELHERVETEVRRIYGAGGTVAAQHVAVRGVTIRITDAAGHDLAPPRGGPSGLEVATRLDEDTWLRTSIPDETVLATRRDARRALLGGGLAVLVLGLAGGLVVTRRALEPIRDVAETARTIVETGVADARVPRPHTGDDLDSMVELFNRLLDTQADMVEQMRSSLDNIGHDLRTPLTRIRAAAEIALDRGDREALESALETALEEAAASEQLLTCLLDLTRAEAGMLHLQRRPVDPADVVGRIAALYEHVADERSLTLEVGACPRGLVVDADPTRLEQALANLADNALRFARSSVVLELTADDGRVGLSVHDDGPGIPEHEQGRVFERLYRGDQSRSSSGAGLGLAMVRAIAVAHGGAVTLDSGPERGTTLSLWLPRASEESRAAPEEPG